METEKTYNYFYGDQHSGVVPQNTQMRCIIGDEEQWVDVLPGITPSPHTQYVLFRVPK